MASQTKPKSKPKRAPQPRGRKSTYTAERVKPALDLIAVGKSTATAAAAIGVNPSTIFDWLARHPDFTESYARAKEAAADFMVEEMVEIADDGRNDFVENDKGHIALNAEHVQRSRLRVDTRKWMAAKLKPKKYGDALDVNHGVQPDDPLAALVRNINGSALKPVKEAA